MNKYDPKKMYQVYDKWPTLARESYNKNLKKISFKNIDHLVFVGMGGSGLAGDVMEAILSKTNMHVKVIKGYFLPKTADSNTLIVISSLSGNTAESLAVLKSAKKSNLKIIAFAGGGKMEQYCSKNNIPFRKIPFVHSPRASFPTLFYSMLNVLENILPITKNDVKNSITNLEKINKRISSLNLKNTNPALKMAYWISGIPLIYYPAGLKSAAIRFKNSIQENAKLHAIVEDVIESSHNGIVSWEKKSNVVPIMIEGKDDSKSTKERWKILKEYFKKNSIDYREVNSISGDILSKLITLIYLLDFTSLYLAVLSKTDPTSIRSIEFMKSRMN